MQHGKRCQEENRHLRSTGKLTKTNDIKDSVRKYAAVAIGHCGKIIVQSQRASVLSSFAYYVISKTDPHTIGPATLSGVFSL